MSLPAASTESPVVALALIGLAMFAIQAKASSLFSLPADLFPAARVGTIWGLFGAAGGFGAALFQSAAGWMSQHYAYEPVFVAVAATQLLSRCSSPGWCHGWRSSKISPHRKTRLNECDGKSTDGSGVRAQRLLACVGAAEKGLSLAAFVVLITVVFADVLSRELTGTGLHWAMQIGVYANYVVVMLGFGLASASGSHLRPRFADRWLPRAWDPLLEHLQEACMSLACLAFAVLAAVVVGETRALGDRSPVLGNPVCRRSRCRWYRWRAGHGLARFPNCGRRRNRRSSGNNADLPRTRALTWLTLDRHRARAAGVAAERLRHPRHVAASATRSGRQSAWIFVDAWRRPPGHPPVDPAVHTCRQHHGARGDRGRLIRRGAVGSRARGLAIATVLSCAVFAAVSGSGTVTLLAIGAVMYPALLRGYPRSFALGFQAGGTLGIIIRRAFR